MIETVFFDFGGTLVYEPYPHADSFFAFLRSQGIEASREEVAAGTQAMKEYHSAWRRAHPEDGSKRLADRFWYHACLAFARHIRSITDSEDLAELMHAHHAIIPYRLYDDAVPALDALASEGVKMAIISNWDAPTLEFALRDLGIRRYFVAALSSRCAECEKPASRIFYEACRRAETTPDVSVMVGDSLAADIQGAHVIGMRAVWINRNGEPPPASFPVIRALTELPVVLSIMG